MGHLQTLESIAAMPPDVDEVSLVHRKGPPDFVEDPGGLLAGNKGGPGQILEVQEDQTSGTRVVAEDSCHGPEDTGCPAFVKP